MKTKQYDIGHTDLSEEEKLDWLRLIRTDNIGPITFYQLIDNFGSAGEALRALPELSKRGGRKKPLKAPDEGLVIKEYKHLKNLGGQIITVKDSTYPIALSAIDDAPPVLSVIGNAQYLNKSCIAIVGARNASLNGKKFAYTIANDLGRQEQIIVSGLARGIDTAAHNGAVKSGTIAVVAGGVDVVYPEENKDLYEKIRHEGVIIAESALSSKPFAASFPRRNRIVSGLSKAVIIVEANLRSGSLITARLAGEQGRDVMAVPGSPMDPRASGPNHLIREGATLIRSADDVLEMIMNFSGNNLREPEPHPYYLNPFTPYLVEKKENIAANAHKIDHEQIINNLSFAPISVDELIRACHVTISELQSVLLELELAGRIKRLSGNKITLLEQEDN